jgi:TRAP-type C4-dicarboxylate transport system permease small subunit
MTSIVGAAAGDRSRLDKLERQCPVLTRPIAFLGVLGMLVVSSITMVDVLLRWIVGGGVVGLNEIVELIFAITVTACIPYGIATRVNLRLDLLEFRIVGRLGAWVDALGMILSLAFLSLLAWRLGVHAQDMVAAKKVTLILLWPPSGGPLPISLTDRVASPRPVPGRSCCSSMARRRSCFSMGCSTFRVCPKWRRATPASR